MGAGRRKLVVGLGNPGSEYRNTRHNVGFMVAEAFARKHGISLLSRKFDALWGKGMVEGTEILVSMPQTYMNLSGGSVSRMTGFYQIHGEDILVVHDDMDLPFGRIRVKEKGGHAGHNGLRSIISSLGGGDFTRLRIGIGRPAHTATDHVLGGFAPTERDELADIVQLAVEAVEAVVLLGPIMAMNRFNNRNVPGAASERGPDDPAVTPVSGLLKGTKSKKAWEEKKNG